MAALCRRTFSGSPVRLVEALYRVELQCTAEALGSLYSVLGQRRGKILSEEMKEGTDFFIVKALLPVASSFGFANDMLRKTSGIATPQLVFSHWQALEQDPFWVPTTEEELEEHGVEDQGAKNIPRELIDGVRRRKGLAVFEKVVESGTKQRTLARKR
mmetsp:Transcript_14714/g.28839  ORF Transcript_14714/g.28839 Transcript_14714/m.28839 type:complete len:158 (+) Transcript_14714:1172-1645(+)